VRKGLQHPKFRKGTLMTSRVEYLITIDQKDLFCKTKSGFNNLLRTIDGLSIHNGELRYQDLQAQYEVQDGEITTDRQRFFHVKLTLSDDNKLEQFELLLRQVRGVLTRAGGRPPQVLWDGLSTNFANAAYPLIHDIENTMRKLITKFMLVNVGLAWAREAMPKEVQDSVRSKDAKMDQNYLYEVDFIQLSNFLFKEYSTTTAQSLMGVLKTAEKIEDLNLEKLKKLIPQSNWDRFFSKIVSCENEYLKVRWEKMYDRRNQIAHNRPMTRAEFEEVKTLYNEISPKLTQAIDVLDQVRVTENERELVSENVASAKNYSYQEFMNIWNEFQENVRQLAMLLVQGTPKESLIANERANIRNYVNVAAKSFNVLSADDRKKIQHLIRLRNYMVHEPSVLVPPDVLASSGLEIQGFTQTVRRKIDEILENGQPVAQDPTDDDFEAESITNQSEGEFMPSGAATTD
jgi:hypothetical protein